MNFEDLRGSIVELVWLFWNEILWIFFHFFVVSQANQIIIPTWLLKSV